MRCKSYLFFCCLFFPALGMPVHAKKVLKAAAFYSQQDELLRIEKENYTFLLNANTLSYQAKGKEGKALILANTVGGIRYEAVMAGRVLPKAGRLLRVLKKGSDTLLLEVENRSYVKAVVQLVFFDHYFSIAVSPAGGAARDSLFTIDFCTGPTGPAYGLGDHGGYGESTAITNFVDDDFGNRDNAHRFISTFAIFPKDGFAQVLFEKQTKRVAITAEENRLGVAATRTAKVYYFIGLPKGIYASYKKVLSEEGYPSFKPKYRFFQLGYEAFGSLGWNTYQESVEADIKNYLKEGFPLKWAVVGSGFWRGERKNPKEGSTTSFGLWDDTALTQRKDGLPVPRYPNVAEFKRFFEKNEIDLLLGLRINFKAPAQFGGFYHAQNDGNFSLKGMRKHYFVEAELSKPEVFRVNFPQGNVFLLNGDKPEAVQWFVQQTGRWGVQGFKEDLMLFDGKKLNNDAKVNAVNDALMKQHYLIMARNGAYAVPGDILRLEDTQYGFDQDRPVINGLNYAASGVAAVYLDIVAGKYLKTPLTDDQERYFVRNAMLAAVSPVMAMGLGPWHLRHRLYRDAVKKAAGWHNQFAAYLYSEAVNSYDTGYPFTMTPLPLAFPEDSATYELASKKHKQYAWLLGESLLATPLYGSDYATATARTIYLPKGKWMDYEQKVFFDGPCTLEDYEFPIDKLPLFIGGKGLLVAEEDGSYQAQLYPVCQDTFTYVFHFPEEDAKAIVKKTFKGIPKGKIILRDLKGKQERHLTAGQGSNHWQFKLLPYHTYMIEEE